MAADILDLRGLKCPLPALLAKRALLRAGAGAAIEILTDDPMAPIDVPHMCRQEGFECAVLSRDGSAAHMIVQRPAIAAPEAVRDGRGRPGP
jgi:tRNA 2-thiouridine synthesizing protein A